VVITTDFSNKKHESGVSKKAAYCGLLFVREKVNFHRKAELYRLPDSHLFGGYSAILHTC